MPAQTSFHVTWVILTGVSRFCPCLWHAWRCFSTLVIAQALQTFRRHSVQWTLWNLGYCQDWELHGWRLMERYERQTKEPWQAELIPEWTECAGQHTSVWPHTSGHVNSTRQFSRLVAQRWTVLAGQLFSLSQTDESSLYLIRLKENMHAAQHHRVIS